MKNYKKVLLFVFLLAASPSFLNAGSSRPSNAGSGLAGVFGPIFGPSKGCNGDMTCIKQRCGSGISAATCFTTECHGNLDCVKQACSGSSRCVNNACFMKGLCTSPSACAGDASCAQNLCFGKWSCIIKACANNQACITKACAQKGACTGAKVVSGQAPMCSGRGCYYGSTNHHGYEISNCNGNQLSDCKQVSIESNGHSTPASFHGSNTVCAKNGSACILITDSACLSATGGRGSATSCSGNTLLCSNKSDCKNFENSYSNATHCNGNAKCIGSSCKGNAACIKAACRNSDSCINQILNPLPIPYCSTGHCETNPNDPYYYTINSTTVQQIHYNQNGTAISSYGIP